ncbi:Calx-beta domain-containing protein, partial [Okeania sp.]|uniref:Calx-beta domain-containing protein n=1 Tax=Okeania sp. TaxID=3100323 RepID=UPI002B4B0FAE
YQPTQGTLTFQPGETQKNITVPILGDTKVEPHETFKLNLSNPINAQLQDNGGIGTIRNNDLAKVSIKDAEITEGDDGTKQLKFDVTLNTKVNKRVEVNYATVDGTAKQDSDYQPKEGKIVFKPNQKKKTITVPILGDTLKEEDETFSVKLSKPKNVQLGDKSAVGTIEDNDENSGEPGDSFQTALDLGKLTEEVVVVDDIGFTRGSYRDTNDFYRFQTDKEGDFALFLDGLFKDANVELYGSGEELINQSKNDGNNPEIIITTLEPGNYFVRVYPQGSSRTPYRLSIDLL